MWGSFEQRQHFMYSQKEHSFKVGHIRGRSTDLVTAHPMLGMESCPHAINSWQQKNQNACPDKNVSIQNTRLFKWELVRQEKRNSTRLEDVHEQIVRRMFYSGWTGSFFSVSERVHNENEFWSVAKNTNRRSRIGSTPVERVKNRLMMAQSHNKSGYIRRGQVVM